MPINSEGQVFALKVRMTDYSATPNRVFDVMIENGRVACPDNPVFLELLAEAEPMDAFGVLDASGRRVRIADGEAYLRALPIEFSGSYLRAELIDSVCAVTSPRGVCQWPAK